ncbi:MAG TPA: ABC transporter permease [Actinocrinis sp.]
MMLRLGLRLTLRAGREALVRLVLISASVAAAVAVLLCVLSDFHAFSVTGSRSCWECTKGAVPAGAPVTAPVAGAELWNYSDDYYRGQTIERLDVAALGPGAPAIPGLTDMPGPGRYYVSPAMARLLASAPRDQLGDRYPGTQAGLVGDAALGSPDELVIVIGYTPRQLAVFPATTRVSVISTKPAVNSTTDGYTYGFGLMAIAMFVPLLILVGLATRLAAARREERYAAMRLVGGTNRQISVIASAEAVIGALVGTLAGVGLFLPVRPEVARVAITGARYFPADVNPTALGYAAVLLAVPVISVCGALLSSRRVRVDPLGIARRTKASPLRPWQPVLLGLGLVMFTVRTKNGDFTVVYLGLLMVMTGMVTCGPWLTLWSARLMADRAKGPSALLAARRLADDPKRAFRAVSGLVLAVFVGTATAAIVPALISGQQHVGGGTLTNVMRASFSSKLALGLNAPTGARVLSELRSYPDVTVLPIYTAVTPGTAPAGAVTCGYGGGCTSAATIVSCTQLKSFPELGSCPSASSSPAVPGDGAGAGGGTGAGGADVEADFVQLLLTDNMLDVGNHLPVVGPSSRTGSVDLGRLDLAAVLVRSDDQSSLERARTLLTGYTALTGSSSTPETLGEVAETRSVLFDEIQRVALAVVGLTFVVAGCSVAVAVAGSVVERKRPFTLLRLTGVPTQSLYQVAVLEATVPLAAAALLAAVIGLITAGPVVKQLTNRDASPIALPGASYYLVTGLGLLGALAVVLAALPILGRITRPDTVRFE